MANDKYVLGKRSGSKQIVFHSYEYNGHTIVYRASVPYKEGAPKSYYVGLVDKKMNQLKAKGKLKKYNEAYIRKMVWLTRRKKIMIGGIVVASAVVAVAVGALVTYLVHFHPDSITLDSETLTLNKTSTRLHQDADITFGVKDFYASYGYSAPIKMDKVVVNNVTLTPDQYTYSNNHLKIGAQYMTGKVHITAEADYVHFENDSWDNIIAFAKRGLRDTYIRYGFKSVVGAEHDILVNNVTKRVRVIGEGHDRLVKNPLKAATLTLELIDPIAPSTYGDDNTKDIYSKSTLRSYCEEFLKKIPIANQIELVSKTTGIKEVDGITETEHYKLFPLSYREIGGECGQYISGAGNQVMEESAYQYYADPYDDSLLSKHKRDVSYWLRTPLSNDELNAYCVGDDGNISKSSISTNKNVVVAFALGETESFITDSWENVCEEANIGYENLKDHYGVDTLLGLEREIILNPDATHPMSKVRARVIGAKHDHLAAGAGLASALTFEFVDSPDKILYGHNINTETYHDSLIKEYMNDSLFKRFPLDLKGNVQKVEKKTVIPDFNEETELSYEKTEDYLFPLSLKEAGDIFYSLAQPYNVEEPAYDFFRLDINPDAPEADLKAIDRLRNHGDQYWLRSLPILGGDQTTPCQANYVEDDGSVTDAEYNSHKKSVIYDGNTTCCFPVFNIGYDEEVVTFANDDWENVCYYAERGIDALRKAYGLRSFIGQQREIILNDGTRAYVHVIGENEDTTVDGKDTVLTFEFSTLFPECGFTELAQSNVPWSQSYVRKYCNERVYPLLPDCVKELVKEVTKKTVIDIGTGGGEHPCDIETTSDKIFVLSVNEIMFDENYASIGHNDEEAKCYKKENPHYSYYLGSKAGNVRLKVQTYYDIIKEEYVKGYGSYWLRSPALSLCPSPYLYYQHGASETGKIGAVMNSFNRIGIAPAFAI